MGTGVMIGAGTFTLTGQVAELAREWFPLAFLATAVVTAFSAYSYVKLSNAYPSAGGIAMFLEKAYGKTMMTGVCALPMDLSMVINESLVARTSATYTLQPFDGGRDGLLVPVLGVGLLVFAFLINILGNRVIQTLSFFMALIKIADVAVLAAGGLRVPTALLLERLARSGRGAHRHAGRLRGAGWSRGAIPLEPDNKRAVGDHRRLAQ
jgi:amino acid transporter